MVEPGREKQIRQSNFLLNQTVALTNKIESCRQETEVVKLEIGINRRIHCSTTTFETVKKAMWGQVENSSTLQ